MALTPELIYSDLPGGLPATYVLPPGFDVRLDSVAATFDGSGAAAAFLACLAVYSQDNKLVGRWFPSQVFGAGDSGEVTFSPFLGGGGSGGVATATALDRVAFEPVGGFLPITSTNDNAPDTVVTAAALSFDGTTLVRIEFGAPGVDVDQRGKANVGAIVLELYEDGVAKGLIGDWNASSGAYMIQPAYASTFLVPSAGTHTYSLRSYLIGGGGGAVGPSNFYGSGLTTPHVTRAGFMLISAYVIA